MIAAVNIASARPEPMTNPSDIDTSPPGTLAGVAIVHVPAERAAIELDPEVADQEPEDPTDDRADEPSGTGEERAQQARDRRCDGAAESIEEVERGLATAAAVGRGHGREVD